MVTIEKLLENGIQNIRKREYNNPSLDAQLILSYILQKDRMYLHLYKDNEVKKSDEEKFYQMIKRRDEGYPLQYMTNSQEFMGLDFYVRDGVLIPRSDTEILVEKIIKIVELLYKDNDKVKILDMGTGSGAIAVSLSHYIENAAVTAVDISETAIEIANINKEKYNLKNLEILKCDMFDVDKLDKKYHIVVSNPPYIESHIIKDLQKEVSEYEPKLALDGGCDGLDYYRKIVEIFEKIHEERAVLSVEIGYNQENFVSDIFKCTNIFEKVESDKDLSGNSRVVTGFL